MKRIDKYGFKILLSLIILNCLIFIYGFLFDSPRPSRFQNAYNACCAIQDEDGDVTGSGALLENGLVLTAAHVIDHDQNSILTPNEKIVHVSFGIGFVTTATVLFNGNGYYVPKDFALLQLTDQPPCKGLKITDEWPILGDRLYTIGCPDGKDLQITDGLFTSKGSHQGICSVLIFPGNSGGPLLNEQLEIVGIVSRIGNSPDGFFIMTEIGPQLIHNNNYIMHQNFYAPATEVVKELNKQLPPWKFRGWTMLFSLPVILFFYLNGRKTFLA